jgi:hypothetical protein
MSLKKLNKLYPIKDSPFYLLKGKSQLEKILSVKWEALNFLLSNKASYRVFVNETGREIQTPVKEMRRIHDRIAELLRRIELPTYLTSRKGLSYIDNAIIHKDSKSVAKTDISKFYPSTTLNMVYKMFLEEFLCAKDIAFMLAKLCCYECCHLPTGSPLSGRIAFFAAKKMFDEIEQLAAKHNCILTIYVDDITVSGAEVNGELLWEIRQIISKHGFIAARKKSKIYYNGCPSTVTGVVIKASNLLLPNKRHKKIWEASKDYKHMPDNKLKQEFKNKLDCMRREANKILLLSSGK